VQSFSEWNQYLKKVVEKMLPEKVSQGTLLDVFHKEYFVYRDIEGK
jgi:hypothetical protein